STAYVGQSVWFSGLDRNWSHANIYNAGPTDPTTVSDASLFPYTTGSFQARAGDTVFFRGAYQSWPEPYAPAFGNGGVGYYGAWTIDKIVMLPCCPAPYTYNGKTSDPTFQIASIEGRWYFQSDKTGNFSAVPEPGSAALVALGLVAMAARRRAERCCPVAVIGPSSGETACSSSTCAST